MSQAGIPTCWNCKKELILTGVSKGIYCDQCRHDKQHEECNKPNNSEILEGSDMLENMKKRLLWCQTQLYSYGHVTTLCSDRIKKEYDDLITEVRVLRIILNAAEWNK